MHYIPAVQVTPPEKPQTLINTPFLGVFLCFIVTAKATSSGAENSPKRYPPSRAEKHPIFSIRGAVRGAVRGALFGCF